MEVMPTISDAQRETMLQYLKNVQESLAASGGRQGWRAGGKLTEDEMIFNLRKSVKNAVGIGGMAFHLSSTPTRRQ